MGAILYPSPSGQRGCSGVQGSYCPVTSGNFSGSMPQSPYMSKCGSRERAVAAFLLTL